MILKFKMFEEYEESDVDEILDKIDMFIKSPQKNIWIENNAIKIYIRKSKRYFKGEVNDFFDFASISVEKTGKGLFSQILQKFEEIYPDKNIFIESVLTDRFAYYIQHKLGFETDGNNNFYKIKKSF